MPAAKECLILGAFGLAVVLATCLVLWVGPPPSDEIPNLTFLKGVLRVSFSPATPVPGDTVVFAPTILGDLAQLCEEAEFWHFGVSVLWLPVGTSRTMHLWGGPSWEVPGEPGAAIFMGYVEAQVDVDHQRETVLALSDPGVISIPGDVPVVFDSPLIQAFARLGSFRDPPFAEILVKIAADEAGPMVTNLTCNSLSRILGTYRSEHEVNSWDYGGSQSCGQGLGENGMVEGGWVTYISKPRAPENGMDRDVVRGVGSGIVVCCLGGKDTNGTIHFATPLIFSPTIDTTG